MSRIYLTKAELVMENEGLRVTVERLEKEKAKAESDLATTQEAICFQTQLAIRLLKDTLGVKE